MVHSLARIYWRLSTISITLLPSFFNLLATSMHFTANMYTPTEDKGLPASLPNDSVRGKLLALMHKL